MNSIAYDYENSKYISERIFRFFKVCGLSEILQKSNAYKEKGISVVTIVEYLFNLVFRNRSAYTDILLGNTNLKQDTIYRFKNSVRTNWIRFTSLLASKLIREHIEPLTSEKRHNVFIIDDSIYERERSKKVELLAQAFEKIQLFLTKLMQGFNASEEDICALFASLIADVPEYIAVFLKKQPDCSTILTKSVCEV